MARCAGAIGATARALKCSARPVARTASVAVASTSASPLSHLARPAVPLATRTLSSRAFSTTVTRSGGVAAPRRPDFKKLDADDVAFFRSVLSSPSSLITTIESPDGSWNAATSEDLIAYNLDWMDKYKGNSPVVLKPKTTDEVSKIIAYCYKKRIAVVPQGGNTGLVGGGVPLYDELVLNTEGMNQIRDFDDVSGASSVPPRSDALPVLCRRADIRVSTCRHPHDRRRLHPRSFVQLPPAQGLHDAARPRRQGFVPHWRKRVDQCGWTAPLALRQPARLSPRHRGRPPRRARHRHQRQHARRWRRGCAAQGQHGCGTFDACEVRHGEEQARPSRLTCALLFFLRLRPQAAFHRRRGHPRRCNGRLDPHAPATECASAALQTDSLVGLASTQQRLLTRLLSLTQAVNVAVLSVPDFESVQTVFKETRAQLGEILSAFEFWDQEGLDLVLAHTGAKSPFESEPEGGRAFYVLIETSGSNKDHDDEVRRRRPGLSLSLRPSSSRSLRASKTAELTQLPSNRLQKLGGLLEKLLEDGIIADGTLAQDETQALGLWSLRESLPEAAGKLGKVLKFDVSVPLSRYYELVEEARERFDKMGLVADGSIKTTVGYGHIGDSESFALFTGELARLGFERGLSDGCRGSVTNRRLTERPSRRQPAHQHCCQGVQREDGECRRALDLRGCRCVLTLGIFPSSLAKT